MVGDDATTDAERKPDEHQPETWAGSVDLGDTTTPPREGQEKCGKEQKFEETEDGKSQAEEENVSLPCAEKSGKRGQQWNEDREQK
ncbi:hypothetical protein KSD_97320 [Ktedonobacter sp. SOSP1-85]|nr:hypothetical protein KSD_97320 [Ktedonobacter sp. SOSP1-85]